jgi:hypothetical protein
MLGGGFHEVELKEYEKGVAAVMVSGLVKPLFITTLIGEESANWFDCVTPLAFEYVIELIVFDRIVQVPLLAAVSAPIM